MSDIVLLDGKKHDRQTFDCGVKPLNVYLRLTANQHSAKDNTRTYVMTDKENSAKIIGYYTLTMTQVDISGLSEKLRKRHQSNYSAGLIARLAVDKRYHRQGYGALLLIDALVKLLQASRIVAFPLVVVDAKEGVKAFYEQYGFQAFADHPHKLFMTMNDIRGSLQDVLEL